MAEKELKKILIAEDEQDIRRIIQLSLELLGGFELEICENGSTVVEKALKFKPDMILLDVMMPVMDGPAALKEIKNHNELSQIPIIFLTAKVMSEEISAFKKEGVCEIIAKPFDPEKLHTQLKTIWESQ